MARHVLQQRLGMDQPGVQGHPVEEGFQRRAGRAQGLDHVDVAEAPRVAEVDRAEVGAHRHALALDHQQAGRGGFRQARTPAEQQVFQTALQGRIDQRADQRRAARAVQAPRQQRREARFLARSEQHRFFQRLVHRCLRPHAEGGEALQHLVARRLGAFGVAIRAQPAGRLRQHREQRRLAAGQLVGRLAEIRPAGRRHALQGAAERRAVEVEGEDLVLGQVPFQLRGAPQLLELAGEAPLVRIEQPRHLHRQRAAAGQHAPAGEVLPGGARQGQRVDPGVAVEPAILVGQQRLQVIGRNRVGGDRVAPHAVAIGEAPQRRAVLGEHHAGQVVAGQRQREQAVGGPQQGERQQWPAQPAPGRAHPCATVHRLRRPSGAGRR
ncbi:hypothetical protein D9M70_163910 [compost metagenome]